MIEWRPYAAALVAALTQAGTLAADWRPAFEQVPRHLFVPGFFTIDGQWVSADDPAQHDRWLAAVYSDEPLTTQIMTAPGTDLSWPTSSSTRPSLVADQAPYERIIATCGVPEIPPEWITQLTTGGLIVADVRGELGSSLVVARKSTPHSVTGRFLTSSGHFMWMRAEATPPGWRSAPTVATARRSATAARARCGLTSPIPGTGGTNVDVPTGPDSD